MCNNCIVTTVKCQSFSLLLLLPFPPLSSSPSPSLLSPLPPLLPPPQTSTHSHTEVEKQNLPVSYIDDRKAAELAAQFLGVPADMLERALCTRKTITRREEIISPLSAETAQDICNAFVKGIYSRQFVWIVKKINQAIFKPKVCVCVCVCVS